MSIDLSKVDILVDLGTGAITMTPPKNPDCILERVYPDEEYAPHE